jgi:hypothetical protein
MYLKLIHNISPSLFIPLIHLLAIATKKQFQNLKVLFHRFNQ